jgi:hypothetical protein
VRAPCYVRDLAELEHVSRRAKGWECPHCRRHGNLNRHGALRGLSETGEGKDSVRGWRFLCSDRGRRGGCGRSFSVLLSTVIAGATVRSPELWRFTLAKLGGASVLLAWERLRSRFSLEAAYSWWKRWERGQFGVRAVLARGRGPPRGELARQLVAAFGGEDPVGSFQLMEQRRWPG